MPVQGLVSQLFSFPFPAAAVDWLPLAAGVVAFGAGGEVLQALLPTGRTGSPLAGPANTLGVALSWAPWGGVERGRR